jgi:hypothetical protein
MSSRYGYGFGIPKDNRLVSGADYDASRYRTHLNFCIACEQANVYGKYKHGMKAIPSPLFDLTH